VLFNLAPARRSTNRIAARLCFCVNEVEASMVSRLQVKRMMSAGCGQVMLAMGPELVIITLGQGFIHCCTEYQQFVPAFKVKPWTPQQQEMYIAEAWQLPLLRENPLLSGRFAGCIGDLSPPGSGATLGTSERNRNSWPVTGKAIAGFWDQQGALVLVKASKQGQYIRQCCTPVYPAVNTVPYRNS
jgi:hypothetical protein